MDSLTTVAVWHGAGRLTLEKLALPVPGEGELLVRIRLATVCGSDLHTVRGHRPSPCPSVLGHEAVGEVIAAGPGAPVHIGQRVVWSVTVSCGDCDRCITSRTAKCRSLRKIGHEPFDASWPLSGSYAEHILLPKGTAVVLPRADIVFEVSGASAALQACLDKLDIGGVAVLVGAVATAAPISIDPERIVRGWHTITGVHNYEPRHLQAAMDFLAAGTAPWDELVAPPVPLEHLAELLANPGPQPRMSVTPHLGRANSAG